MPVKSQGAIGEQGPAGSAGPAGPRVSSSLVLKELIL